MGHVTLAEMVTEQPCVNALSAWGQADARATLNTLTPSAADVQPFNFPRYSTEEPWLAQANRPPRARFLNLISDDCRLAPVAVKS